MTYNIEKLKKEIEKDQKSLTLKISDLKAKITNIKQFSNYVLLCDVSDSMNALIGNNKEKIKAIDCVNEVLASFRGAKVYEFSTDCNLVPSGTKLKTKASTNMAGAFIKVKTDGHKEIILITDGAPDSVSAALLEANGLKISIIYIGPKPIPEFLTKLGRLRQNKIDSIELIKLGQKGIKEIENKIKGFLNA